MSRNRYRLNEERLNQIISENIKLLLHERHVIKLPKHNEPPMDMGADPSMMGNPMMGDPTSMGGNPNAPMGGDEMGGFDGSMGEDMGDGEEGDPVSQLQKKAGEISQLINGEEIESRDLKGPINQIVKAYTNKANGDDAKDTEKILKHQDSDNDGDSMGSDEPMPQMESRKSRSERIDEIIGDLLNDYKRKSERPETKITNGDYNEDEFNPYVANR